MSSRFSDAQKLYAAGLKRVAEGGLPLGQKYPPGGRVRIVDNLGPSMSHFPAGRLATVQYTYAQAYGGDDVDSYSLNIDGLGTHAWYRESHLLPVDEARDSVLKIRSC